MSCSKDSDDKIPSQHKSAWFSFIKSIATFKGDLASITAPPFLLSPQSITEFSAYWAEHPSLFVAPAKEADPEKRALLVLRWFLSTLRQQHSNMDENGNKKRMKPLNPFLGEIFRGRWVDEVGRTELVAEQVSHHPPATACRVWNEEHGISLEGNVAPKVYFSSTVHIDRKGYSLLHIKAYDETCLITMPKIHIEGLITGSLFPELSGSSYIRSSSGYTTKINYSSKGWLSGKKNSFTADVYHDRIPEESLYTAEGQWSDEFTIVETKTGKEVMRFDVNKEKRTPLMVKPLDEQHALESRRAWRYVVEGIKEGDIFKVGTEKSKIENEQREMRKREKREGKEYQRRVFERVERDEVAEGLMRGLGADKGLAKELDSGHGLWVWDEEKYRKALEEEDGRKVKSPTRKRFDSGVSDVDGLLEPLVGLDVLS